MEHLLEAIEGKHVANTIPMESRSEFYNCKKYHSMVLMAIVDAQY